MGDRSPIPALYPGLLCALACLAVAGCPGSDSPGGGDDDTSSGDDDAALDPCAFSPEPVGTIQIEEGYFQAYGDTEPAWHAQVGAQLWGGPSPGVYTEVAAGECRVLLMDWAECSDCGFGEFCVEDGVCEPYPEGASGGALTVTGLDEALVLTPEEFNQGAYYGPGDLPSDLFDAGDPIAAILAGDTIPAAAFAARGVARLEHPFGDVYQVDLPFDEALDVSWTPGDDPDACVRLDFRAPTRGHGLTITAFLSCVSPDDGEITIPAALLALFPEGTCPVQAGSDCRHSELTRYTAHTVSTPAGDVALQVRSGVYFYYDHRR